MHSCPSVCLYVYLGSLDLHCALQVVFSGIHISDSVGST